MPLDNTYQSKASRSVTWVGCWQWCYLESKVESRHLLTWIFNLSQKMGSPWFNVTIFTMHLLWLSWRSKMLTWESTSSWGTKRGAAKWLSWWVVTRNDTLTTQRGKNPGGGLWMRLMILWTNTYKNKTTFQMKTSICRLEPPKSNQTRVKIILTSGTIFPNMLCGEIQGLDVIYC